MTNVERPESKSIDDKAEAAQFLARNGVEVGVNIDTRAHEGRNPFVQCHHYNRRGNWCWREEGHLGLHMRNPLLKGGKGLQYWVRTD